jgi:prophage tail gpP-like protein
MMSGADISLIITDRDDPAKVYTIKKWTSYNVTLDVMQASNNFTVSVPATQKNRDMIKGGGSTVRVFCRGIPQLSGIVDERSEDTSTDSTDLHVSGRDYAGLLLDCVAPKGELSIQNLTVEQIAQKLTVNLWPSHFLSVETNAAATRYVVAGGTGDGSAPTGKFAKFGKASPAYAGTGSETFTQTKIPWGSKIWDVLQDIVKQIGCAIWIDHVGHVIITRPCYKFDASAYGDGITLHWDAKNRRAAGGNVQGVTFETSIAGRCSEYDVGAVGKMGRGVRGKKLLLDGGVIKDPSPAFWEKQINPPFFVKQRLYKPGQISERNIQDARRLTRLARREMCEKALAGFNLEYKMRDHLAPSGAFWVPDSCVKVLDERNGLNDVYYIHRVERRFDQTSGRTTVLKLIPRDIWLSSFDQPEIPDSLFYAHHCSKINW